GNIFVTGSTNSPNSALGFPATPGALQTTLGGGSCGQPAAPCSDAFVTTLNPAGAGPSDLVYSTYLGGNLQDIGHAIALDAFGGVYVAGETSSSNFPGTSGVPFGGVTDAVVVKLLFVPAPTNLAVSPASGVFGGPVTLSAKLTSAGAPVSGRTISFTLNSAP